MTSREKRYSRLPPRLFLRVSPRAYFERGSGTGDYYSVIDTPETAYQINRNNQAWHAKLGNGAIADAVIDRVVYKSHVIHIEGEESMRKRMGGIG